MQLLSTAPSHDTAERGRFPKDSKRLVGWTLAVLLTWMTTGCGASQPFVWASDLPSSSNVERGDRPIGVGDSLAVVVQSQETLNSVPVVSSDGFIVLPLLGALRVQGKRPAELKGELERLYATSIDSPRVSVVVVARRLEVSVVGEVTTPGKYVIDSRDGVINAVALAGGLTPFADEDAIYVVRASVDRRIRFRVKDLVAGGRSAVAFELSDRDLIVVE